MLPSKILEESLITNRRHGWMPRGPGKGGFANTRHPMHGSKCCYMTAMCRMLRNVSPQGFALPEAFEARRALREVLGVDEIAEWNDTRISFAEIEDGVMKTVRVLRARGR